MIQDITLPQMAEDPVAVALQDASVRRRLENAARAFLCKRWAAFTPGEQTAQAQEVVQNTAVRALEKRNRFDPSRDVLHWLMGILRNVAREYVKQCRREAGNLSAHSLPLDEQVVDPSPPVGVAVDNKQLAGDLLARLSPSDRDILVWKCVEQMTCAEIGERLAMKENAVRVRVFRAMEKLRRCSAVTGEGQP
jgi:RNA polymerase sigma-70 factor (ECF subfamily)